MLLSTKKSRKSLFTQTLPSMVVSVLFLLGILAFSNPARAADIVLRSVNIGSSLSNEVTFHDITYTTATGASIGSVKYEYCTNMPFYGAACTVPAGLVVNAANIDVQTGLTGFSISAGDSNANRLVLTRTASFSAPTAVRMQFSNITNQSNPNQSVYIRISTHASLDGSGTPVDNGAVVYSTAPGVGIGGYVPPYLTFCVGVTVALDCSSTTGSLMEMGEFSQFSPSVSTSQFAAATNDYSGYNTYISGGTMTSGNEIIPALSSNSSSVSGTSQFGINLRSNSSPFAGANVSGVGTGVPTAGYNSVNSFRYGNGEQIAYSPLPTEYNRFTVTYLVNVSENQAPGIYASSFTFTAVASF